MSSEQFNRFVFVDFENVPKVDLGLVAGQPVHVTLLIGKTQKKLDTSLSLQLHQYAAQVTPIEVGASGRNALDITLACYLGQAIQRMPGCEFFIVSKDKDYDPALVHLRSNGAKVSRHDSFAALPFLSPAKKSGLSKPPFQPKPAAADRANPFTPPVRKKPTDGYAKLLEQIRSGKSRPGSRANLMRHIHTVYGQKSNVEQQTSIVNRLINEQVITIDEKDKVRYL